MRPHLTCPHGPAAPKCGRTAQTNHPPVPSAVAVLRGTLGTVTALREMSLPDVTGRCHRHIWHKLTSALPGCRGVPPGQTGAQRCGLRGRSIQRGRSLQRCGLRGKSIQRGRPRSFERSGLRGRSPQRSGLRGRSPEKGGLKGGPLRGAGLGADPLRSADRGPRSLREAAGRASPSEVAPPPCGS